MLTENPIGLSSLLNLLTTHRNFALGTVGDSQMTQPFPARSNSRLEARRENKYFQHKAAMGTPVAEAGLDARRSQKARELPAGGQGGHDQALQRTEEG